MKRKLDTEILNTMRKNPENWKGVFYFNRKDPALIVPKYQSNRGLTLNFGNPLAYVFIILIIAVLLFVQWNS